MTDEESKPKKSKRGLASMSPEKRREIASMGGKTAHAHGKANRFTPEKAAEAGRKGGEAIARDREWMATIGRRGGIKTSSDTEHMSEIGRKGGRSGHWLPDVARELEISELEARGLVESGALQARIVRGVGYRVSVSALQDYKRTRPGG